MFGQGDASRIPKRVRREDRPEALHTLESLSVSKPQPDDKPDTLAIKKTMTVEPTRGAEEVTRKVLCRCNIDWDDWLVAEDAEMPDDPEDTLIKDMKGFIDMLCKHT